MHLDRPAELKAYLDAKVHLFLLPGTATRSQLLELLSTKLAEICALATARRPDVCWLKRRQVVGYERHRDDVLRRRKRAD